MAFKFENLKVWQASLDLADDIDKLALTFPKHELYSLSSQIKRAADSVSLNIVEGSTGLSNLEFKRFLRIANRSALEVVGCLFLAKRRSYISDDDFNKFYLQIETLVKCCNLSSTQLKINYHRLSTMDYRLKYETTNP